LGRIKKACDFRWKLLKEDITWRPINIKMDPSESGRSGFKEDCQEWVWAPIKNWVPKQGQTG